MKNPTKEIALAVAFTVTLPIALILVLAINVLVHVAETIASGVELTRLMVRSW